MRRELVRIDLIIVCLMVSLLLLGHFGASKIEDNKSEGCSGSLGLIECDGQCVNIQIDRDNCGECRNECNAGDACMLGKCISISCKKDCDDGNPCTNDFCKQGKCVNELK